MTLCGVKVRIYVFLLLSVIILSLLQASNFMEVSGELIELVIK